MAEEPKYFFRHHTLRDWVVKWSFAPAATARAFRYTLVRRAAGEQEALRIWRERTLAKWRKCTKLEPVAVKVYPYRAKMGLIGEARRMIEAETPKSVFHQIADPDQRLIAYGFRRYSPAGWTPYYLRQLGPVLFKVGVRKPGVSASYFMQGITGAQLLQKQVCVGTWEKAIQQLEAWGALEPDPVDEVHVGDGDALEPVGEAEEPKAHFRSMTAARRSMRDELHCFKDFHYLRSVPRPEAPEMIRALHTLQRTECNHEDHVFTVLDLDRGFAFHQKAVRVNPTQFRTFRMWKSEEGQRESSPSWESLVAQLRLRGGSGFLVA